MIQNRDDEAPATRLVRAGRRKQWTGPIVNPPIHRASTILYDDAAARIREANNKFLGEGVAPYTLT